MENMYIVGSHFLYTYQQHFACRIMPSLISSCIHEETGPAHRDTVPIYRGEKPYNPSFH
jgi:hypothetical protein